MSESGANAADTSRTHSGPAMQMRGTVALGAATVVAFASVLPQRSQGDTPALAVVLSLWCVGLGAGSVGTWWTSGNRPRFCRVIAMLLGMSAARTAAELLAVSAGHRLLVSVLTAMATAVSLIALFRAIGRANPDYANKHISWRKSGLPHVPFEATVDGDHWQIRVNTRPGSPRYTLLVDNSAVLELESWPPIWNPDGSGRAL